MTTYIKDLIDLPEKVHGGDFVLKLTEGIQHPVETLAPYVVTPQLAECFDAALDFIRSAVESGSSKATYLHGSFGSGKSHFMAVLHLLLQQRPEALSKDGLAPVVSKHNSWLDGRQFLLVPYHMIGQPNMESAILGGYVRSVLARHPDAPVPAVYRAEGLFGDARELRNTMGDEAFFGRLNRGSVGDDWGALSADWDAASFEAALLAGPDSEARGRLIGALVEEFFQSYKEVARGSREAYVSLDDGLAIISRHARSLGYDGLVLFLDELILWLATHAADQQFLNTEGPKISKLVEAEAADRPIPIISFVARQRDLRELVGESITGAQQLGFADVLQWWQARFDTITLEDRNLPEIAARRVLAPRSEAARQQMEQAYADTARVREDVLNILLTPKADRSVFRKVYPFSPALVETLVAVSSVLQRERTALKVMLQLLVNQRDTLELGQVVPVGDLFAVIAEGDEPFTEGMRLHFENAKRLYYQRLQPMLAKECELTAEEVPTLPAGDPKAAQYRAGDRLLKTLLLAALVPEVEVLKGINPARLAALNHGSIRTPIPGREPQMVLSRCKNWAAQVGELKIGDDPSNPSLSLHLTGVDTETILANAQAIDNPGNRRRKIRDLLFSELCIAGGDQLFVDHKIDWRGTSRSFEVIFGNVRELTTESFATKDDERKIIIDFPFDEPGRTPAEDIDRLDGYRATGNAARTLVWLPSFLSLSGQKDLGTLVKIDHILAGERFRDYATHLSAVDQSVAREQLRNQGNSLRQRLIRYLEGAYGVDTPAPGSVDSSHSPAEHFQSLDPGFAAQPPVGANLKEALEHLLDQMLQSQFPAHPRFGADIRIGAMRKVHEEVERAIQDKDGRIPIDRSLRGLMMQIAVPLKLGEMGETHFVLGRHWYNHFTRHVQDEVTVGQIRAAMDKPDPMGLPDVAQNLVILVYAAQANRAFFLHGGPYRASLDSLPNELELRDQPLPDPETWNTAIDRAGKVFGISASPLLNASNVADLAVKLGDRLEAEVVNTCRGVAERLDTLCESFDIDRSTAARPRTARAVSTLVQGLAGTESDGRVALLCKATLDTSPDAMGTSFRKAASMQTALENTRWALFETIGQLGDDRKSAAEGLRKQLVEALSHDEYAVGLATKLAALENDAIRLLAPPVDPHTPPAPPQPVPVPLPPDDNLFDQGDRAALASDEGRKLLNELAGYLAEDETLRLDLNWKLYTPKRES